ncbi:MAG: NAD(P)H-binding protein [Bacteroidota bacterium]|nr:NAD(P)H-binding protein [Bacteroidota bacterium]
MHIFLTGSTGYVGNRILLALINSKNQVSVLVRNESVNKIPDKLKPNLRIIKGDVRNNESYAGELSGCDAVIYLPGLIREFPKRGITFQQIHFDGVKNMIDSSKREGVKRFLLMSANGVKPNASTEYLRTKYDAEEYLKQSGLNWTIFRPSVIFGDENEGRYNFISVIVDLLNQLPLFVPVIGNGEYRFQPISIYNVADAFVKSLEIEQTIGRTYSLCGKEVFTYNQLVNIILKIVNRKKMKLHIPVWNMKLLAKLFDKFDWFPVTHDQIMMLLEENICRDEVDIFVKMNIKPIYLEDGIKVFHKKFL